MERRMMGNYHVRCGTGEKMEIISKSYLSSFIPTVKMSDLEKMTLPETERNILLLVANRLLCATGEPHIYEIVKVGMMKRPKTVNFLKFFDLYMKIKFIPIPLLVMGPQQSFIT